MVALARLRKGQFGATRDIAQQADVPYSYLGKLLQTLTHSGLVKSQKGIGGGVCLARGAKDITLLDVLEPIDEISQQSDCLLGHKVCNDKAPCAVHDEWKQIRRSSLRMLRHTTVADLLERKELVYRLP
jgi:Rrf2 family protein